MDACFQAAASAISNRRCAPRDQADRRMIKSKDDRQMHGANAALSDSSLTEFFIGKRVS
jgi:hypothetical protein